MDISASIKEGKLYGYIQCDISTPSHLIDTMKDFPPVIKRMEICEANLTDFMRGQLKKRYPKLTELKRQTVVQCFNAENHLLLTSLAKFYLEMGLQITRVTQVIQYIPFKCLKPFTDHVTKMRIEAELEGKTTKGNTAKTFGNAGYGKVNLIYLT